jgi:hypothetical protein
MLHFWFNHIRLTNYIKILHGWFTEHAVYHIAAKLAIALYTLFALLMRFATKRQTAR